MSSPLLSPGSVAVIGASSDERKVGHLILRNLLTQGYEGAVFPVNPKGGEILGKTAFRSVGEIPQRVDMAVIVTPAETVEALAEECGKKGVASLVVISAGFGESGAEGKKKEENLRAIAEKYGMQLVGPNCLGIMRPSLRMNASFGSHLPPAGGVALLSQSGALGEAFIDRAAGIGLGLSLFVSMGNKAAMDESDFLELCAADEETRVIGLYLENIQDGRRFLRLARSTGRTKPVVLLKAGTTERGRAAASSHTGALAGSEAAVRAICAQGGIHLAATSDAFLDLLRTLSLQPPLPSPRIAVVTNAGGPGVLAADAAEREGLELPPLTPAIADALAAQLPASASVRNPIDVLGDALADRFEHALAAAARNEETDGAVVIVTPQVMTPATDIARAVVALRERHPLFPVVACFMGGDKIAEADAILRKNGIPNFPAPETAVRMLARLQRPAHVPADEADVPFDAKRATKARTILEGTDGLLDEDKTARLFSLYGLPLPRGRVAATADEAVHIATEIGFPVAAKVSSPDILHKTDMGGVRVDLKTEEDVRRAFGAIMANAKAKAPQARVAGVLIQELLPPGNEFIVGALRDPDAGPLVMAGLGGIYTELFRDAVFRLAPLAEEEAYPMLAELRSWRLLQGMRGKGPLAVPALARLLASVSVLIAECPAVREIDLNPVLITEKNLTILDAKVVVWDA
ncbi:MAG: acetate--CoA ligase family protein [Candidatus Peribacteraceae bacterium]|nr:acetate--CoA ligase family protein [Candidatus Peribacteraceae bacterium]